MKTLWKSFKITIAFCIFFSLFYILVLWIFAQFAGPNKGNAEVATLNGKVVGAANVGLRLAFRQTLRNCSWRRRKQGMPGHRDSLRKAFRGVEILPTPYTDNI